MKLQKTDLCSGGTSFHGTYLETTVNKLIELFGEPQFSPNDEDAIKEKSQYDWTLADEKNNVVTIYDWKEYRVIDKNELISFHIGGFNQIDTLNALKYIIGLM
jgi:hypothetical protein